MNSWPIWKEKLEHPLVEGGMRVIGTVKKGTLAHPLISYVTVVRNNPHTLARAIESVQRQTYDNIEHIIIDGASTDNTLGVIRSYESKIDYYASEPDKGIYDALNKAIELCHGQLLLVLNSDDWLTDNSALLAVENYAGQRPHLTCGSALVHTDGRDVIEWKPKVVSFHSYFSVANLNHNAIYASREAYELSGPYDSSYKIAGDFKWIMTCFEAGVRFTYTDEFFVNYSMGGASSDAFSHYEESKRIIKEKFIFLQEDEIVMLCRIYYSFVSLPAVHDPKKNLIKLVFKYGLLKKNFAESIYSEHDFKNKSFLGKIYFSLLRVLKYIH